MATLTADQVVTAAKFAGGLYRERAAVWWSARVRRDLFSRLQSGSTDPYPTYAEMRRTGPVLPTRLGTWSTTGHALCNQVLRSRDFGVDDPAVRRRRTEQFDLSLLDRDPPDHTRLRRLANPAFSPRLMRGYEPMIESTMHRLLDRSGRHDQLDFVSEVAAPLPIAVITTSSVSPTTTRTSSGATAPRSVGRWTGCVRCDTPARCWRRRRRSTGCSMS